MLFFLSKTREGTNGSVCVNVCVCVLCVGVGCVERKRRRGLRATDRHQAYDL